MIEPPVRGTCYGFEIRSWLDFAGLRSGRSGDPLEILESASPADHDGVPEMEWKRTPDHDFEGRLYVENGGYRLWTDREGWFEVHPDSRSVKVPRGTRGLRREVRLWGIPTVLCFLRRGDLSLHAAAVEVDGAAVLLAAPGRQGKTTLAAAFLRAGYRVLAEDISCCRAGDEPVLFPGPALIRLRPDAADHIRLPGTVPVAVEAGRVCLSMVEKVRGDGSPVPVGGVIILRRGDDNGCRLERVSSDRVLPDLWALSWKLPTDEDRRRAFRGLAGLAGAVPAWNLHRSLDFDSLEETVHTVVSVCRP